MTKNQPPVAGAIKWARSLLARLKQTMSKLQATEPEIIRSTEVGQMVELKYKGCARAIMAAEKRWWAGWSESINSTAMTHLKHTIFTRNPDTRECTHACMRTQLRMPLARSLMYHRM